MPVCWACEKPFPCVDHGDSPPVGYDLGGRPLTEAQAALLPHLVDAEHRAWDSLARYKFQMFGYWAAIWVHLNRIGGFGRPNPWRSVVMVARDHAPVPTLAAEQGVLPIDRTEELIGGLEGTAEEFEAWLAAVNGKAAKGRE